MKKAMSSRGFWIVLMVIFTIAAGGAVAFMVISSASDMNVCAFWSGFARTITSIIPGSPSLPCPFS